MMSMFDSYSYPITIQNYFIFAYPTTYLFCYMLSLGCFSVQDSRSSLKSLQSTQLDDTVKYLGNERNSELIDRKRR